MFIALLFVSSTITLLHEGKLQYDLNLKATLPVLLICVISFTTLFTITYIPFVGKPDQVTFPIESANNATEFAKQLERHIINFSREKRTARRVTDSEVIFIRDNIYLDWLTGKFSLLINDNEIIVNANKMYITDIKAKFKVRTS
jgi:hypothetical protein